MKKFLYSNYTKFVAAVIFVVCIVAGALTATNGINNIMTNEKDMIYEFENDFSESSHLVHYLYNPESVILNAYYNFYDTNEVDTANQPAVNRQAMEEYIEQQLNDLYVKDKINYYVKWNDKVFTNCKATLAEDIEKNEFYYYAARLDKDNDHINREQTFQNSRYYYYMLNEVVARFDDESIIEIAVNIKDDYLEKCRTDWERQEGIINDLITETLFFAIAALLMLIYLVCVCGKNKNGELKAMWIDNVWLEVHLAVMGIIGFFALYITVVVVDEVFTGSFPKNLLNLAVFLTSSITSSVILTSLLSVIRNIKCRNIVKTSIVLRVIRWCFKTMLNILRWLRNGFVGYRNLLFKTLSKKTGVILISMLFAYTALIGLFGIFTLEAGNPFWIFVGIALFVGASFLVAHRAKDIDEIKKGASEVRNGNVAYKIPELKSEDMKALADDINDIAKGLDESVAAKVRAERLKTELITNVSHDLKTPITSIISYTELLSKIEKLPEDARDYVQVISKKSKRLKNLTQDLFDISKVQSGNEKIDLKKLDIGLLINQALGEHDSEITASGLVFCVNIEKGLIVEADGRKMSRVIGNLLSNALKYSMKNTRVFVTAMKKENEVMVEIKNIASYEMNFDANEITGRFVRGDEARTSEGSGLGLAIAKSYTEACGGRLEVMTDGDLFKAIIRFIKVL